MPCSRLRRHWRRLSRERESEGCTLRLRGGLVLMHPSLARRAGIDAPFACAAGWYLGAAGWCVEC
jgi:hypothetical protein